jgi:hypothetical protein
LIRENFQNSSKKSNIINSTFRLDIGANLAE